MEDYLEQLEAFFRNLRSLSNTAVFRSTKLTHDSTVLIETLIHNTFDQFESEERNSVGIIANSFMNTRNDENFIADLFLLELKFFNAQYDLQLNQDDSNTTVKDGLKNGKTIKDSLEKLIKAFIPNVPGWLKKVLHIINEILGITKTLI